MVNDGHRPGGTDNFIKPGQKEMTMTWRCLCSEEKRGAHGKLRCWREELKFGFGNPNVSPPWAIRGDGGAAVLPHMQDCGFRIKRLRRG